MSTSEFSECEASTNTANETPDGEYARRLSEQQRQLAGIRVLHQRLWTYLIVAALAGIVVAWVAFSSHLVSALWILLPSAVVLFINQSLKKNARLHSRVQRIVRFYELGLARLRHQWQGRGVGGEQFRPDRHAYASDLDLFGTGSLFELLCTARTGIGRTMLANWLLNPAECDEVAGRQAAVAELRLMLHLREDWASVGGGSVGSSRRIGPRLGGRSCDCLSVLCAGACDHPTNLSNRSLTACRCWVPWPSRGLGRRRSRRTGSAFGRSSSEENKADSR